MTNDWADEIAFDLFMGITLKEMNENGKPFEDRIAAALRKAREDGRVSSMDSARIKTEDIARLQNLLDTTIAFSLEREDQFRAALRKARQDALEEAAKVAWDSGSMGSGKIADAIRALKDKQP